MELEEKKALLQNDRNNIVILFSLFDRKLVSLFSQIPWEHGGMGGRVGKKYEVIKGYLKWNVVTVKEYTPLFERMEKVLASIQNTEQKE